MAPDDTALLIRYAAERAEEAFAELVRRNVDAVYSSALRRVGGDAQLAEDVTQKVFIALARQAGQASGHPALSAWLFTVTRNEAANVVRSERRRKAREQEAYAMQDSMSESEAIANWSRLAPLLDSAIDQLGEVDRTAVILRYIDRRSFAEIGAAMRVSEDAARMRVDRALDKLRAQLARAGIDSTAAGLAVALTGNVVTAAPAGLAGSVTVSVLEAAAVTPGPIVSLLKIMSTTKVVTGIAGVAAVLSLGTATHEIIARRNAEAALAAAASANETLRLSSREAERRAVDAERAGAEVERLAAALQKTPGAGAGPNAPGGRAAGAAANRRPTTESVAAGRAFVAQHPEVRKVVLDYHHAQLAALFGPFYKARGFTEQQIAQFDAAMMGGAGVFRMVEDADGNLLTISTPTFGDREKRRAEDRQLFALLGPEGVQELRGYMSQVTTRHLVNMLATQLYSTAAPLTGPQAEQLVTTLAAAGGARTANGNTDWDLISTKAQGILSETQLAGLAGLRAQREYDAALAEAMRRNATLAGKGQ